jgi:phosphoribosylanthranilate isomerase
VKICCIQSHDEAVMAMRYGASALGLVAAVTGAPGALDDAGIAAIVARLPPDVTTVLVTTHHRVASIIAQQQRCRVTAVQLCDRLMDDTYQDLRAALPGVQIMQVIHVTGEEAWHETRLMAPQVDGLVLDSGRREGPHKVLGGTGRTHDWHISRRICQAVAAPVWLAGGLNPANVADAIRQVRPYGVDLCSGVRTDGRLDEEKVCAFFAAINSMNSAAWHTLHHG